MKSLQAQETRCDCDSGSGCDSGRGSESGASPSVDAWAATGLPRRRSSMRHQRIRVGAKHVVGIALHHCFHTLCHLLLCFSNQISCPLRIHHSPLKLFRGWRVVVRRRPRAFRHRPASLRHTDQRSAMDRCSVTCMQRGVSSRQCFMPLNEGRDIAYRERVGGTHEGGRDSPLVLRWQASHSHLGDKYGFPCTRWGGK